MPNGTYGGVRGKETKIGREKKNFVSLPTQLPASNIHGGGVDSDNVFMNALTAQEFLR